MTELRPVPPEGLPPGAMRPTPQPPGPPPRKRSRVGLVILIILLAGSLLLNFILGGIAALDLGSLTRSVGPKPLEEVIIKSAATSDRVAVISVEGLITEHPLRGHLMPGGTDYSFLKEQVDRAMGDDRVKAVVLSVNSPGGEASASDMMYRELRALAARKPLVVHMGSLAASGGYYVSMAGRRIIAQPTCLTGSIGVILQRLSFRGLMEETLKIKADVLTSGEYKDSLSPFRDMNEQDRTYFRETFIDPTYERFLDVVQEGRPSMGRARIRELANGKVYTARVALASGLIDLVGSFDDAVSEARNLAGLAEARVVEYRRQSSLLDILSLSAEERTPQLLNVTPQVLDAWSTPRILMLWQG